MLKGVGMLSDVELEGVIESWVLYTDLCVIRLIAFEVKGERDVRRRGRAVMAAAAPSRTDPKACSNCLVIMSAKRATLLKLSQLFVSGVITRKRRLRRPDLAWSIPGIFHSDNLLVFRQLPHLRFFPLTSGMFGYIYQPNNDVPRSSPIRSICSFISIVHFETLQ